MADDFGSPGPDQLDLLRTLSARLRVGQGAEPHEVQSALEAGFGLLITLEAELSRLQAGGRPSSEAHGARLAALKSRIEALSDALTDVRTLSVPPGEARIRYGFVLPGPHGHAPRVSRVHRR
jgi:hypothetical protein